MPVDSTSNACQRLLYDIHPHPKADYARIDVRSSTVTVYRASVRLITHNDDLSESIAYVDSDHNHPTAGAAERCARKLTPPSARTIR